MRRPYRSASIPKMIAPTGRKISVAVRVATMWPLVTANCLARTSSRKTTTKKSNASSVQPRKPARTAWREAGFIGASIVQSTFQHGSGFTAGKSRRFQAARRVGVSQLDAQDGHADAADGGEGRLRLLSRGRGRLCSVES